MKVQLKYLGGNTLYKKKYVVTRKYRHKNVSKIEYTNTAQDHVRRPNVNRKVLFSFRQQYL